MKKQMKRLLAGFLCLMLVAGFFVQAAPAAKAVTDANNVIPQLHYGEYDTQAMIYDSYSCYSMQGMTTNSLYAYCAKIGDNDARAIVVRVSLADGSKVTMKDSRTGYYYFTNLGHANAMDIATLNGRDQLFVTNGNTLERMVINTDGTSMYSAGSYTATYNGAKASMTAVQIMHASSNMVKILVKTGVYAFLLLK